ncbi:MAG: FtsK/SpoIIIE domain-containing protein, partial [Actinomyces dentalis]
LDRVGDRDDAPADADGAPGFLPPLVIGLEDLPGEQAQRPMTWDYTRAGHLGVAGAPRSGRSNLLRTLAVEIARTASPADVHVYGLDAGSGALAPLVSMAHTGAVVTRDQADRVRRLLTMLGKEVARRQQALALEGFSSLAEQRAAAPADKRLPYLVVLLDRWDGFLAVFETVNGGAMVSAFETLMREGAAVGVRVVVTGDRTAFRGRTGMLLEDRLVLRMPAADDYELVGMRARDAPASMPAGRAFRSGPHPREVQVAVLDADPSGTAQTAAFYREARAADERWGRVPDGLRPARVDDLPLAITAAQALELGPTPKPGWISLGVGGNTLAVRSVSMEDVGNGVLITGPRRSGRSTALAFALQSALDNGTRTILILPRRSPLTAWADHPGVVAVLDSTATAAQLTELLGKDKETLVVFDDFDVMGKDHVATAVLDDYMRSCRDAGGGVLMVCNIDEAQGLGRNLLASMRKNRTGLLLAPRSAADGSTFSTTLPRSVGAPVPLGRAIMITTRGWAWVQIPHTTAPARAGERRSGG